MSGISSKYFITSDYTKFTNKILVVKPKNKKLINESNISGLIKRTNLDGKIKN